MKKILLLIALVCFASSCDQKEVSDERLQKAIEKYIAENPDKVIEALQKGQEMLEKKGMEDAKAELSKLKDELYNNKNHPAIGNLNAPNVLVEFFDYNCGYCKHSLENIIKIAQDNNSKIILIDYPVLGEASVYAAKASVAMHLLAPNKFFEFHKQLLAHKGMSVEFVENLAEKLGVDAQTLNNKIQSDEVTQIIAANLKLGHRLNITGTPAFVANDEIIVGAVSYSELKNNLNK